MRTSETKLLNQALERFSSIGSEIDQISAELNGLEADSHFLYPLFVKMRVGESVPQSVQEDVVRKYQAVNLKDVHAKIGARLGACTERLAVDIKILEEIGHDLLARAAAKNCQLLVVGYRHKKVARELLLLVGKSGLMETRIKAASRYFDELKEQMPVEVVPEKPRPAEVLVDPEAFEQEDDDIPQTIQQSAPLYTISDSDAEGPEAAAPAVGDSTQVGQLLKETIPGEEQRVPTEAEPEARNAPVGGEKKAFKALFHFRREDAKKCIKVTLVTALCSTVAVALGLGTRMFLLKNGSL